MLESKRAVRLGKIAYLRTKKLNDLIATLQNTTIGGLLLRVENNEDDIITLDDRIDLLNTKMNSIASLFGITFNTDGTINTESYTPHTHGYTDSTIPDTADGTGTVQSEDKETGAVIQ